MQIREYDPIISHKEEFAHKIAEKCLTNAQADPRFEWSYKTATLYGFGILTTLGYGKVEPRTLSGRLFTVIYGLIGIPITVILLTNLGRYLERLAFKLKQFCYPEDVEDADNEGLSSAALFFIMVFYMLIGSILMPLLHGQFDFMNGIYFAFICLTAIEYGDLVPDNNWFIPVVILYVCIGLAISTIALDVGSYYVRKMHYIGRKLKNIANIRIWFGARDLRVKELVNAVGQNIGIGENVMAELDIERLVHSAILVKLGMLPRVPQTHMIIEGIWPPELVPLFLKDGQFPIYVDSDDVIDLMPKRTLVRFQDDVICDTEDITTMGTSQVDFTSSLCKPKSSG
ncbi:Ion channel [Dictyocaulus viviparus]|uniref:Ion channel n=1 Tax=Dictyocaulus viviparus TaxID=29172 RepID=A0A0D8X8B0_DICVI|nr:Ion channel [Dictyocaulus viviparus]